MERKVRRISYKNSVIHLCIGFVLFLTLFFLQRCYIVLHIKCKSNEDLMIFLFFVIGIIVLTMILESTLHIFYIYFKNKELKNLPYGIDYDKELSTYIIIGTEKRKVKNEALKFNKYTEWKSYLESNYKQIMNNEDAYHFMIKKLRGKQTFKELLLSAIIPVEIGLFTVFYSSEIFMYEIDKIISIFFSTVILAIIMTASYCDYKQESNFILDFIEIIFPEMNNK